MVAYINDVWWHCSEHSDVICPTLSLQGRMIVDQGGSYQSIVLGNRRCGDKYPVSGENKYPVGHPSGLMCPPHSAVPTCWLNVRPCSVQPRRAWTGVIISHGGTAPYSVGLHTLPCSVLRSRRDAAEILSWKTSSKYIIWHPFKQVCKPQSCTGSKLWSFS